MAVSDLTNTTWMFNNYITASNTFTYNLLFTSNNTNYSTIKVQIGFNYDLYYDNTAAYLNTKDGASWTNTAYKTIVITGGSDVTNASLIAWLEANATQITVNDLTNTTWVINSTTCTAGYAQFSIFGTTTHQDYSMVSYFNIGYKYTMSDDSWRSLANTISFMSDPHCTFTVGDSVTFTGGTDVTNLNLISWLLANATQITVSDLTNTTWLLDDGFDLPQYQDNTYNINFTSNGNTYSSIHLDDDDGADDFAISYGNTRVYGVGLAPGGYTGWSNQAYRTIEITGGQDVTNTTFIVWLEAHATQQVASTGMYIGTKKVTDIYVGNKRVLKVYVGNKKCYEYQAPSNPTFSIADQYTYNKTFEFVSGMTWEQWISSAYNTDGYFIAGSYIMKNAYTFVKTAPIGSYVSPTDLIEANHNYFLFVDN